MVFDKVKEVMMDAISCKEEDLQMDARLKEDLGIDSLDAVELSMALEEEFNLTIDAEDLAGFVTIGNIVEYIEKKQD